MLADMSARQHALWPPPDGLPWAAHVLVADTNVLARSAWFLAGHPDQRSSLEDALGSGRSYAFIAAHVPGEMSRAIRRIARGLDPTAALAAWELQLAPRVRVVDIPVALHLNPAIGHVLREDPDDLPTAALALFLAPSVVLTTDGVFADAGLPVPDKPAAAVKALEIAGGHETTAYVGSLAAWAGARGAWAMMGRLVAVALRALKLNPVLSSEPSEEAARPMQRFRPPPGQRRTRVTARLRAEMIERYQAGETSRMVAEGTGTSKATVLKILREAGVELRPTGAHH